MNGSRGSLGLQWKLAAVLLVVSVLGTGLVVAGYYVGTASGLQPAAALAAGAAAGLVGGLVGSGYAFMMARRIKLRLWDAGDMAGHIARGDFRMRLPADYPDEVGLLEEQMNRMAEELERAVASLNRLAEQNRTLAEEAGRGAALEERAKLARDLHDTVNQQLFVLAMRTAAARKRLEKLGGEASVLVPELAALEELARGAHSETRGLILQLRPTTLEQQGLGPALAEYVKAAASKEGWEAELAIDLSVRLTGQKAANLFRVAQETLNNISKHAGANTVWVTLARTGEGILLRITDDGQGFDPRADVRPTSVGLVGMHERVAALGGALRVKSAPGEGTEIAVTLPLTEEGDDLP